MENNLESTLKAVLEQPLPEAGGVAFAKMYGYSPMGVQFEINLTARGSTPIVALESLVEAMAYATHTYEMMPHPFKLEGRVPVAESNEPIHEPEVTPKQASVPETPKERKAIPAGGGEVFARTIKILPQVNGRVILEFWQNDTDKYPQFKWNAPIEMAYHGMKDILKVDVDSFEKAGIYNADVRVVWKPSKDKNPYTGEPYRNIYAVELQ